MAILERELPTLDEVGDIVRMNDSFRLHLAAEGRSNYGAPMRVEALRDFLTERGMPRNVHSITREHVESYIASLLDAFPGGVATTQTPRTYFYHLKSFFGFLVDVYEELPVSPMANMKPPKVAERVVAIVPEITVRDLLKRPRPAVRLMCPRMAYSCDLVATTRVARGRMKIGGNDYSSSATNHRVNGVKGQRARA